MSYRAIAAGCYISWSPSLHRAYREFWPSSRYTVAKIGRSTDIFARNDSLNGIDTYRSAKPKAISPNGWGHVTDWTSWRIRSDLGDLTLSQLEATLQDGKPRLKEEDWKDLHLLATSRGYAPKLRELYITDIKLAERLFPTIINDIVPELREIDEELKLEDES